MADADRCVCCGEIVPEGRQVCPQCERKRYIKENICKGCLTNFDVLTDRVKEKKSRLIPGTPLKTASSSKHEERGN